MTLDRLMELIVLAEWFTKLGSARAAPGLVALSVADWQRYMQFAVKAEFGIEHDAAMFENASIEEMIWLPTGNDEPDPIHGTELATTARRMNRESELQMARTKAFRAALASQRKFSDSTLLKVGPTDSNDAARSAGRFACRMAASEVVVDQVGFWCDMVHLFQLGHWPLGRLPIGSVVVL